MKNLSRANGMYTDTFAKKWTDAKFVQVVLAQLLWCHQLEERELQGSNEVQDD